MPFFSELSLKSFLVKFTRLAVAASVNVLVMNYVSRSAIERGNTNFFDGFLLAICFFGCVFCFQDSIKTFWRQRDWQNTLYFAFATFSIYYFFKIYICCVPIPGEML
jgi:hypothetical protein